MAKNFLVDDNYSNQRLDNFLFREMKGVPKGLIYRLIRTKKIRVNGLRVKPEYKLKNNDNIICPDLSYTEKVSDDKLVQFLGNLKDQFIFEDEEIIVINKPSGLAVHGGSGLSKSVVDILKSQYKEVHLVHRLDRDTSGCLIIAKKRRVLLELQEQLRDHQFQKYYVCLVQGQWPKHLQKVTSNLKKITLPSGERKIINHEDGKVSTTLFRRIACTKQTSLLVVKLVTGRMHQIRAHCAQSGYPIIGDDKYGGNSDKRLYLHAIQLGLGKQGKIFTAPLDNRFLTKCCENNFGVDIDASSYF